MNEIDAMRQQFNKMADKALNMSKQEKELVEKEIKSLYWRLIPSGIALLSLISAFFKIIARK